MKRLFLTCAFFLACTILSASETSDKFTAWLPDFASADLAKQETAQQGWQSLCRAVGNNNALRNEVIKLTIDQLAKENPVETSVWLIRQLGIVGNASAVSTLAKFLDDKEVQIRDEAARALANISGPEAAAALKKNNSQLAKDALTSKAHKQNIPLEGVETAMPQAIPYASEREVAAWMRGYDKLSNDAKAQTVANLATRAALEKEKGNVAPQSVRQGFLRRQAARTERVDQRRYLPTALEAAKSSDANLRDAGLLAVGALGSVKEVPFLLEQSFDGGNKGLAKLVLSRITASGVDEILINAAKTEKDANKFVTIADILSRRYNKAIQPVLLDRAKATDTQNRLQLLQMAEPLSSKDDVGGFVDVWELVTDRGQKNQVEQIVERLTAGDAAPVLQKKTDKNKEEMLSLLGRIGDEKTLGDIKKNPNALNALSNWPNGQVADDLLAVAGDQNRSEADRITALRAFARVASLPADQIKIQIQPKQQVELLKKGYDLALRDDERRLIIERVGKIRTVESLKFVIQYFDTEPLQEQVNGAILDLAHHVDLKRSAKDDFNAALDKVLSTTKNQGFLDRAKRYKDQQ
jgi:HEAT repeat protein